VQWLGLVKERIFPHGVAHLELRGRRNNHDELRIEFIVDNKVD